MKDLMVFVGIIFLLFEDYRLLRGNWIRRILAKRKVGNRPRKLLVMQPKSELDWRISVEENRKRSIPKREMPAA
jgi:hypothetical protein